jgi:hypothetical protein
VIARIPLVSEAHQLGAPMPWVVDQIHEPLGCELIRQPLHALAAGRPHLCDLRHGERTDERAR